jgi:hypothetical protein
MKPKGTPCKDEQQARQSPKGRKGRALHSFSPLENNQASFKLKLVAFVPVCECGEVRRGSPKALNGKDKVEVYGAALNKPGACGGHPKNVRLTL